MSLPVVSYGKSERRSGVVLVYVDSLGFALVAEGGFVDG
jgi:hypothetical protein